jgi:hypothetical protein
LSDMPAKNARYFKSDLSVANLADTIVDIATKTEAIYEALVVDKNVEVTLSGSKPEQASAQDTQVATTTVTYTKAVGATQMEVYCETGYVRVRTDGQPCTGTTGEPIAAGFGSGWLVDSISVYFIQESVITVVSR